MTRFGFERYLIWVTVNAARRLNLLLFLGGRLGSFKRVSVAASDRANALANVFVSVVR